MTISQPTDIPLIGVGLRHAHIEQALNTPAPIDFIEVHTENFFAQGGPLHHLIRDIAEVYPVSLHSTAMGLGSAKGIPDSYLDQLSRLAEIVDPTLMSDHAAFAWGDVGGKTVHGGDLLPIVYNEENLNVFVKHVEQIQQRTGKQLLIENLSAYLSLPGSTMNEQAFLVALAESTGCGLLLDLNNILVNARNNKDTDLLLSGQRYLDAIPVGAVGEIHLAGYSEPAPGAMAVDDHAHPVTEQCWSLYSYALKRFGAVPTLIEWDNQLPTWEVLVGQAVTARGLAKEVLQHG